MCHAHAHVLQVNAGIVTFGNIGRVELNISSDETVIENTINDLRYTKYMFEYMFVPWRHICQDMARQHDMTKFVLIRYYGENTNTAAGLERARNVVLANGGNRADIEDVILLITDGVATLDVNGSVKYLAQAIVPLNPNDYGAAVSELYS